MLLKTSEDRKKSLTQSVSQRALECLELSRGIYSGHNNFI